MVFLRWMCWFVPNKLRAFFSDCEQALDDFAIQYHKCEYEYPETEFESVDVSSPASGGKANPGLECVSPLTPHSVVEGVSASSSSTSSINRSSRLEVSETVKAKKDIVNADEKTEEEAIENQEPPPTEPAASEGEDPAMGAKANC